MEMMEKAKQLVIRVYGNNPHIADIRQKCTRWHDVRENDYRLSCGMFRQTLIPKNHQFVIKTGLTVGGNRQCKREMEFYNASIHEGLQEYFSECYGRFKVGCVWFYVYEYINDIGNHGDYFELNNDSWNDMPFYWINRRDVNSVVDFCEAHDINDLHVENFGFKYGHAVMTDYSGFWQEDNLGASTIYPNRWDD